MPFKSKIDRCAYMSKWNQTNKGQVLRKKAIMERACRNAKLPALRILIKYDFTQCEIDQIRKTIEARLGLCATNRASLQVSRALH